MCKTYKVNLSGYLITEHRLLVMELRVLEIKGKKRALHDLPRNKWGSLTTTRAQEMWKKLMAMGA